MRIALIGMPTSGKSVISNQLSAIMGHPVIDLDGLLEKEIKSTLQQFISQYGEKDFILKEDELLQNIKYPEKCIISTGGSVIYATDGMLHLKNKGTIFFYLYADISILEKRLASERDVRGIVMNGAKNWHELLENRDKLYRRYANFIIDTNNKSFTEIVKEIASNITT